MDLNPFTQAGVIMSAAAHRGGLDSYGWMQAGMGSPADATGWIALTFAIYAVVGLAFLALAAAHLTRSVLSRLEELSVGSSRLTARGPAHAN